MQETDIEYINELLTNLRFKEAIIKIEFLLKDDPLNIILLEKIGDSYIGLENYEEAMNYHSQAYKLDTNNQSIKSKLLKDIHLKEIYDNELKYKKIKDKKNIIDFLPFFKNIKSK